MSESDVQLNVEGTGPRVRTTAVTTYEDPTAPTASTVEQQVVVLADRLGTYIEDDQGWREAMLGLAQKQLELLQIIADAVTPGS
jgi:hypothetical protein